jgi:hypothetical protein
MARAMKDVAGAEELAAKAATLRDEATRIDGRHYAPAWAEDERTSADDAEADASFAAFMARRTTTSND